MNRVFTAKLVQMESEKPVEVCMVCKDVVSKQHWSVLLVLGPLGSQMRISPEFVLHCASTK